MKKEDRQEMLLCSYYDGQSGFFGSLRARRLLARCPKAREFYEQLSKASVASASYFSLGKEGELQHDNTSDLWERVSQRIDQEERAALYLGNRKFNVSGATSAPDFGRLLKISTGFAGSMAIAAMALFVFLPAANVSLHQNNQPITMGDMASSSTRNFTEASAEGVNYVSHERVEPLRITENRLNRAMEVDWMRSQGRVRLIQAPSERSAIIWVKRDRPELPLEENDNPIRIINERVPTTRSAFGE